MVLFLMTSGPPLGAVAHRFRVHSGLTLGEAARQLQVDSGSLSAWEKAKRTPDP